MRSHKSAFGRGYGFEMIAPVIVTVCKCKLGSVGNHGEMDTDMTNWAGFALGLLHIRTGSTPIVNVTEPEAILISFEGFETRRRFRMKIRTAGGR